MKKPIMLGLLLALILSTLSISVVFAGVINVDDKNSDFGYSDIVKDDPTFADTEDNKSAHDNSYFYVPGANAGSQRIHANYTANTDACAACHFTHSAPGTRLLQWGSIFEACAACHDGSLGEWSYDVFAGTIGLSDARTFGGLFGSTVDEVYDSNNYLENPSPDNPTFISSHMSNGYMALAAAPGSAGDTPAEIDYLQGIQFDCASCHTPHGQGGNARILNPDPGKLKISNFFPASGAAYPVLVNKDDSRFVEILTTSASGTNAFQSDSPFWIQGYPYNRITGIFVVDSGVDPAIEFNPQDTDHKGIYSEKAGVTQLVYSTQYTIDWRQGIVDIIDGYDLSGKQVYAVRVPGIFVVMKITNILKEFEEVEYVELDVDKDGPGGTTFDGASDPNGGINAFCGACHGKYNTQGNEAEEDYDFIDSDLINHGSGHFGYEGMYRHQVGFKWLNQWPGQAEFIKFAYPIDKTSGDIIPNKKIFTCLGCHFAHGVNDKYWYDYVKTVTGGTPDGTYAATLTGAPEGLEDLVDMEEIYGSSALKRLPNMGTCEDCHNKSEGNSKDTIAGGATYY